MIPRLAQEPKIKDIILYATSIQIRIWFHPNRDYLIVFVHEKEDTYFSVKVIIFFLFFKFQFACLLVCSADIMEPLLCGWHIGVYVCWRKTHWNALQSQDRTAGGTPRTMQTRWGQEWRESCGDLKGINQGKKSHFNWFLNVTKKLAVERQDQSLECKGQRLKTMYQGMELSSPELSCFFGCCKQYSIRSKQKREHFIIVLKKILLELSHLDVQWHYQEPFQHAVCHLWLGLPCGHKINQSGQASNVDTAMLSWKRDSLFPFGSF